MESSPYQSRDLLDATVVEVRPDSRRLFLVVSGTRPGTGKPWTLVLERENDYWISRRSLEGIFSPEEAVSGFLFNREGYQDPIDALRRMNESVRTEYDRVLQEKIRIERARAELARELVRSSERGEGRARRSSGRALRKPPVGRRGRRSR